MALGRELKDFLAAFTALRKQSEDARYHSILEDYYKRLGKGGKDDPVGDAFTAGKNGVGTGGTGGSSAGGTGTIPVKVAYQSARDAGFSDNQARALTAELGRENGLQSSLVYGSHVDPKNGATNVGALSWQGSRATGVLADLKEKGLLDDKGNIKQTPEALTEQFRFMKKEMQTDPAYAETKKQFLDNPNIDPEAAAPVLGKNYIRWRYDDPAYASHHQTRKNFLADVDKEVPRADNDTPGGELANRPPAAIPSGKKGDAVPATVGDAGDSALPDSFVPPQQVAMNDTSPSNPVDPSAPPVGDQAIPDSTSSDYSLSAANGGMIQPVKHFLGGGPSDDDDEEEDDPAPTPGSRNQPPGLPGSRTALPVGGQGAATAPTQDEGPAKDGLLGMALHAGFGALKNIFGMSEANAAENTAVPAQQKAQGQRLFMSGMGAMNPQDYDEVMKSIDPNGQMDEHIRNIAGIKGVYEYYMKRGESAKASQAAASMIQYSRQVSAQYATAAEEAIKSGNYTKGADLLKKAYNQTPDGNTVDATVDASGHGLMTITDQKGKVIGRQPFTPQAMLGAAVGMKDGSLYYNALVQTAGSNLGNQPSDAYKDAVRRFYGTGTDDAAAPPPPPPASDDKPAATAVPDTATPAPETPAPATPGATPPAAAIPETPAPDSATGATPAPAVPGAPTPPAAPAATPPAAPAAPAAAAPAAPAPAAGAIPDQPELPALKRTPIVPFEKNNPRPEMPKEKKRLLATIAETNPSAARTLQLEWENENVKPWQERKKDYETEAKRQSDLEYNQSVQDRSARDQSMRADRREKFSQDQQTQREMASQAAQTQRAADTDRRAKELEANKQAHELRMKALEQAKPLDFDTSDEEKVASVQNIVKKTIRNAFTDPETGDLMTDDSGKPVDPNKMYPPDHVQAIRDAAIQLHRYNRWPLDTAAQAVLAMTNPSSKQGGLSIYKTEPIKGSVDDPTHGQRVKVTFQGNNALAKNLVLPQDIVDRIDVIRGAQMKRMVKEGNELNAARLKKHADDDQRAIDDTKIADVRERQRKEISSGIGSGAIQTNIDERPSTYNDTPYVYGD